MYVCATVDRFHLRIHSATTVDFADHVQGVYHLIMLEMSLENIDWMASEILHVLWNAFRCFLAGQSRVFHLVSVKSGSTLEEAHRTAPPSVSIRSTFDAVFPRLGIVRFRVSSCDVLGGIIFIKRYRIGKTVLGEAKGRL